MKLYYENKHGEKEYIGNFATLKLALNNISEFWTSLGKELPYIRVANHDDGFFIDFGSHTYFYHLIKDC